jgi:thiamine biosynthesis lipoprotein
MKQLPVFRIVTFCIVLTALMLLSACKSKPVYPSDTREALGTRVTIRLYVEGQTVDSYERVFNQAFATMAHWEQMTLSRGEANQVYKISEGAGTQSITVDPAVFEMLMAATRLHDVSGKFFDVRMGPLYDAWGFDGTPTVPDSAVLANALSLVRDGGMFVGMRFDVRAFVEGYVFDLVATQLREQGFTNFLIESPQVFLCAGTPPESKGFELTLHRPDNADSSWATLTVPAGAYAYVSPIKNRFERGGKVYHSLLNPNTGMPANSSAGVIVNAENAATAQALAYALFVKNADQQLPAKGQALMLGSGLIRQEGNKYSWDLTGSLSERLELIR